MVRDDGGMSRTRVWVGGIVVGVMAYTLGVWSAESTARAAAHGLTANPTVQAWGEEPADALGMQCTPEGMCCKVCSKGRACGDTCISAQKSCHKGRGCACDAAEVCE